MTTNVTLAGAKGGSGTTVAVAALALELARRGRHVTISAAEPDQLAAVFGAPEPSHYAGATIAPGILWGPVDDYPGAWHVHDAGTLADVHRTEPVGSPGPWRTADYRVLVLRNDYLAVRASITHGTWPEDPTGALLIEEPGRALGRREVTDCLDVPVWARLPIRDQISRVIDAGLLAARTPDALVRAARDLVDKMPRHDLAPADFYPHIHPSTSSN